MKLGSLFDGSGTCPLAGQMTGFRPVWASEIEPFPIAVTTSQFPKMEHLGDITKIKGDKITPVDFITFGSPCQDLSVAGKRAGLNGERSGLFMEAVRIIKEMRGATNGRYPQIAMWENVPGAFSSNKGEDFQAVLEELCKICDPTVSIPRPTNAKGKPRKWEHEGFIVADGFSIAWRLLDAQFWGVPQRRKRIFLVADFGGQCAGQILFECEGLSRDFRESREKGQNTRPFTEKRIDESNRERERESSGCGYAKRITDRKQEYDDVSESPRLPFSTLCNHNEREVRVMSIDRAAFNQGKNAKYDIGIDDSGKSHTLVAKGPGAVAVFWNGSQTVSTLTANNAGGGTTDAR